ncbi:hypothetical protein HF576_01310 [Microbacterium sp. CFH 90308]|uniref:Uncharacterized protein n=1 Tax=Microbacterium salsuginis TaxID=2722803 RepID=A0ABX1KAN9_9MICO|nr:hypothetical protein [Microbacterium sp. CFH 90308]NLP82476.1 hypothetical protein [Microbacterium sp. CFH 90308]
MATELVQSLGSAYWAAIAQIVPVLAIPLVIEARLVAHRLSESEESFNRRARRAGWGLVFTVLGISMLGLEILALSAIPLGTVNAFDYWFSIVVVVAALSTVFAIPLAGIANSLLTDIAWILRARLPWGYLKRTRRELRVILDRLETQVRGSRSQRLQLKTGLADAWLMRSQARAVISRATPAAISEDPALLSAWNDALAKATASIPDPAELVANYESAIADVDDTVTLGELAVQLARRSLDELESLIHSGATQAQITELRIRTAALAQAGSAQDNRVPVEAPQRSP